MHECRDRARMLGSYLDGELEAAKLIEIDEHVGECETCREETQLLRAMRGSLKRVVRTGANTLLTYHDPTEDLRIAEDDTVYLDFGPVFDEWEADFGRTYALGNDPDKHRLVRDIGEAFREGKEHFQRSPNLTAGELYDYVVALAPKKGWHFAAPTAGHLIGKFPHERLPDLKKRFSIRHGNEVSLREPDETGAARHWILEIHFVDRERQFGGFLEELLTV